MVKVWVGFFPVHFHHDILILNPIYIYLRMTTQAQVSLHVIILSLTSKSEFFRKFPFIFYVRRKYQIGMIVRQKTIHSITDILVHSLVFSINLFINLFIGGGGSYLSNEKKVYVHISLKLNNKEHFQISYLYGLHVNFIYGGGGICETRNVYISLVNFKSSSRIYILNWIDSNFLLLYKLAPNDEHSFCCLIFRST